MTAESLSKHLAEVGAKTLMNALPYAVSKTFTRLTEQPELTMVMMVITIIA